LTSIAYREKAVNKVDGKGAEINKKFAPVETSFAA